MSIIVLVALCRVKRRDDERLFYEIESGYVCTEGDPCVN